MPPRLDKVSIAVKTFGVCDVSRLAVTDWRLRRWRLWFLALMTATQLEYSNFDFVVCMSSFCLMPFVAERSSIEARSKALHSKFESVRVSENQ